MCDVVRAQLRHNTDRKCSGSGAARNCRAIDIYRYIYEVMPLNGPAIGGVFLFDYGHWTQDRPSSPNVAQGSAVGCLVPRNVAAVPFADLASSASSIDNRRVAQLDKTLDDVRRADSARTISIYIMIPAFSLFVVFAFLAVAVRDRGDFVWGRSAPASLPYGVTLANASPTTVPASWRPVGQLDANGNVTSIQQQRV